MGEALRRRNTEYRRKPGSLVKKAILPAFCFAAMSTAAFEETVFAAQMHQTKVSGGIESTIKYINIESGSLNLRSSASTSAAILTGITKGTLVKVYSETNGWAKVSAKGKLGYVSSNYLSTTNPIPVESKKVNLTQQANVSPAVKYVTVSSGSLNMRNAASAAASIIVKIAKGTQVKVYSESGGWSKISAYGHTGYVSSEFLGDSAPSAGKPLPKKQSLTKYVNVASGSGLNLRKSMSLGAAVLTKLTNGTEVTVFSESNGWAEIIANGQTGYVYSSYLAKTKSNNSIAVQSKETKYVNVNVGLSLNMVKSPSEDSSIMIKLARGSSVTVFSEVNGWSKIEAFGQAGYVKSASLSSVKPAAGLDSTFDNGNETINKSAVEKFVNVIYGSSLNLRSAPSSSASIVTKLARGTIVTVYTEANGWANVSANGKTGYVSANYLSLTEPFIPGTISKKTDTSYESYNLSVNDMTMIQMAASPQTDKKYDTYIRADALTLNSPSTGTANGSGWNIRGGAGTTYWIVGKTKQQETYQVLSKVKGDDGYDWYKITYNKTWVNASPDDVAYYLDPSNFLNNTIDSMQFLKLSAPANIDGDEVNERILAGKGILQGRASAFITAGNSFGINEIYLIAHALLETNNGSSILANGVEFNDKTVYNMYGIGAVDSNPIASGAQFAYNAGWYTPEEAIIGGAQFIANEYIKAGQDTLYKMRWNPNSASENGTSSHQYASDIGWAAKQVKQINNLYSLLDSYKLILDIPKYQ